MRNASSPRPMGSLSERDRLRMAELIRAPRRELHMPAAPPKKQDRWRWSEQVPARARQKLSAWSTAPLKQHFVANWRQWALGGTVIVLCLVVLGGVVKLEHRHGAASIQLQARDRQGELQIRWDPDSDLLRGATSAKL